MKIVGCDLHTRYQQIAMLDERQASWLSDAWNMLLDRPRSFIRV